MLRLRSRCWRVGDRFLFDPSLSIVLSLALLVAGCGGREGHAPTADARVVAPPQAHFRSALAAPPADLEADGLPVQRAPLMERTRGPVDPSEPFSRDYGSPSQRAKSADATLGSTVSVRRNFPSNGADHALVNRVGNSEHNVPADAMTVSSRVSVRDLPDDLPPDFRERLIVMGGLR
ncbi:MAG: hypothetical protein AB7U75_02705 [Hyphomicrobiaceae bacterium]